MSDPLDVCDQAKPILLPEVADDDAAWYEKGNPAWSRIREFRTEKPLKPLIRCKCGEWSGIDLHHVHADGTVTGSFFHATKEQLAGLGDGGKRFSPGCGWHVYLKLQGYDCGDFPPDKTA